MPVQLVNMIPRSLSDERAQDSEPSITVNPQNPQHIVGTAFTPDPFGGPFAPIYFSTDGGATWALNFIVPSEVVTGDITVAFGGAKGHLYAGILRLPRPGPNQIRMNVLRSPDFRSPSPMAVLDDRNEVDQPFVCAATIKGKDRLLVGGNDFAAGGGKTATIDRYLNAGTVKLPKRQSIRIEVRTTGTAGQNGPAIRPTIHPDGRAYGVFYGWRSFSSTRRVTADVVVVRDDAGGGGAAPFTSLKDRVDGQAGQRVVTGVTFTWNSRLGQQRVGGDLSIAVDPTDSSVVYVAWAADGPAGYTVTVQRSQDGGQTWSVPIRTVANALNPALTVNAAGTVGLLVQQLQGSGASSRWVTQFDTSPDGGASWTSLVLATVPATTPSPPPFQPYIGDFVNVVAVGKDFYGIFSANNTPDLDNFPNGVTYQRNHDFQRKQLLDVDGVEEVPVSIDPFFFKATDL